MAGNWKLIRPEATTNLVTNPSFETNTTGWSTSGTNTIAQSSAQSLFGNYSLLATYQDSVNLAAYAITVTDAQHTFSAWVYIPAAWDGGQIRIRALNFASSTDNENSNADMTITDAWQRIYVVWTPDSGDLVGHHSVYTASAPTAGRFIYVDGVHAEALGYATTYCDGDQQGCKWNGAAHGSTSTRKTFEASGGRVLDLEDDLNTFLDRGMQGVGLPQVTVNSSPLALQDGSIYEGTTVQEREVILQGYIKGTSLSNLHTNRQTLIKAISPQPHKINEPMQARRFRYTGATVTKEIDLVYRAGLEGSHSPDAGFQDVTDIRFMAPDPNFYQIGETGAVLDLEDSTTFTVIAAKIDGVWDNMGPPDPGGTYSSVRALVMYDKTLYIGGDFVNFDNQAAADNIVSWDGDSYSPLTALSSEVNDMAVAADGTLYVGGLFLNAGGDASADYLAQWNGSAFSAVGVPNTGAASITAVYAVERDYEGNLYVGGDFTNWADVANADYVAMWNGSSWAAVGTTTNGIVRTITRAPWGVMYFGGEFTTFGGTSATRIASYDPSDSSISALGSGFSDTVRALLFGPDGTLYIGGDFAGAGAQSDGIASWDGNRYGGMGTGVASARQVDKLAWYQDELIVVGPFTSVGGSSTNQRIATWNGSRWSHLDVALPSAVTQGAVLADGDDLYVGLYTTGAGTHAGNTAISYSGTAQAYVLISFERSGGTSAKVKYITNRETRASLLLDFDLLDGEKITIDTRPGQQSIFSTVRGNVYDDLLPNSDFGHFYLTPGNGSGAQTNNLVTYIDNDGATITGLIRWRDAYESID
jgi:hypothetical protein